MKIGIIGIGTVGEGVLKILSEQQSKLEQTLGEKIEIKKICDLKEREFSYGNFSFTSDYREVVNDPSIDTVIELIGGIDTAYDVAFKSLENGKNLITANKYLLAEKGSELFKKAEEKNVKIFFEAAVGGGIPVLSPLKEGLFPNEIISIRGILNGTCNYILSRIQEGKSFHEALEDAQEKGFAESDPTFDIEGIDTSHKIILLAFLAWGELKNPKEISIEGISSITPEKIQKAEKNGKKIKLLGEAFKGDKGITVRVSPVEVNSDTLLFNVDEVYNAVEVEGSYTGKTLFYGKGAGMDATASAVVSDIFKIKTSSAWIL